MQVFDLLFAVFALDVVVGHAAIERPRPVKSKNGDQILETVGPDLHGHLADARAFQLEHAGGVALTKRAVSFFIVERQMVEIDLLAAGDFDELQAVMNQRESLEAEKVEFDQTYLLHPAHFVLSDDAAFFIDEQRQMIDQRQIGKHNARRMGRSVAHQSFQAQGVIHQSLHPRIVLHQLGNARLHLHRLGQRIIESLLGRGNQLGDGVGLGKRETDGAADISDCRFGFKRFRTWRSVPPGRRRICLYVLNHLRGRGCRSRRRYRASTCARD